jgi:hypothetical protein
MEEHNGTILVSKGSRGWHSSGLRHTSVVSASVSRLGQVRTIAELIHTAGEWSSVGTSFASVAYA